MDQDAILSGSRPRPAHIVLDGDPAPPPKWAQPQLSTHICCGQTAGWMNMPLGREVGLSPGHIALDGDPAPPQKGHSSPHFSAHIYCDQTAGWIKMPLGTKVGLSPCHVVLDGVPAHPHGKGHNSPHF